MEVGPRCIVMENAVLRGRESHPLRLGHSVLVGPNAHLNGTTVDDGVFWPPGVAVARASASGAVRRFASAASCT